MTESDPGRAGADDATRPVLDRTGADDTTEFDLGRAGADDATRAVLGRTGADDTSRTALGRTGADDATGALLGRSGVDESTPGGADRDDPTGAVGGRREEGAAGGATGAGQEPAAQILVVDDNADMRAYLARLLTAEGWTVRTAGDGEAALRAILADPPDLLITDVMMPQSDGFALVRTLRREELTRGMPIVMLSARAGGESGVEGLDAGADDYIVKPFASADLIARVRNSLRLARVRAAVTPRSGGETPNQSGPGTAKAGTTAAAVPSGETPNQGGPGTAETGTTAAAGPSGETPTKQLTSAAQTMPAEATTAQATPAQTTATQTTPPQATPAQTTAAQTTPPLATPSQTTPAQTTEIQATPPQATPVQTTPAQTRAAQATSSQATAGRRSTASQPATGPADPGQGAPSEGATGPISTGAPDSDRDSPGEGTAGPGAPVVVPVRGLPDVDVVWTYPLMAGSAGAVRRDLRAVLPEDKIDPDLLYDLQIATTEAVNNAVEHAQDPGRPYVEVRLRARDGLIRIEVQDYGTWRARPPARDRGRGAVLMNAFGDVRVTPSATGTLVTIERRWIT